MFFSRISRICPPPNQLIHISESLTIRVKLCSQFVLLYLCSCATDGDFPSYFNMIIFWCNKQVLWRNIYIKDNTRFERFLGTKYCSNWPSHSKETKEKLRSSPSPSWRSCWQCRPRWCPCGVWRQWSPPHFLRCQSHCHAQPSSPTSYASRKNKCKR